jgi:membrane protein DedA with SNARE-associated domain
MVDGAAIPIDPAPGPKPIDRAGVILFAVPMAVTTILAWVGDAFAPTLIVSAPVVLILCNPRLRNLVLVAPTMASSVFISVSVLRLVLTDPFFYWFGRKYGDVAIRWMQDKLGPGAMIVLWLERFFARTSYVAVAAVPNQWICLLAGATRMRIWVFVTLNVGGTLARVLAIWWLGDTFSEPILALNGWIADHRIPLTAFTFALVGFMVWRAYRKGENQIMTADELADELEVAREETD